MEQVNESSVIRKLEDRTQGILWDHGSKTDRTLHPTIIGINELQTFFFLITLLKTLIPNRESDCSTESHSLNQTKVELREYDEQRIVFQRKHHFTHSYSEE